MDIMFWTILSMLAVCVGTLVITGKDILTHLGFPPEYFASESTQKWFTIWFFVCFAILIGGISLIKKMMAKEK